MTMVENADSELGVAPRSLCPGPWGFLDLLHSCRGHRPVLLATAQGPDRLRGDVLTCSGDVILPGSAACLWSWAKPPCQCAQVGRGGPERALAPRPPGSQGHWAREAEELGRDVVAGTAPSALPIEGDTEGVTDLCLAQWSAALPASGVGIRVTPRAGGSGSGSERGQQSGTSRGMARRTSAESERGERAL